MEAALGQLPFRQPAVITLRDVDGYGAEEVCAVLGIPAGNQRVLLHRARAAVRARLEEYFTGMLPGRAVHLRPDLGNTESSAGTVIAAPGGTNSSITTTTLATARPSSSISQAARPKK